MQQLESNIDYSFTNRFLLELALTAPGAEGNKEGTDNEKVKYEGNRLLARLGKSLLPLFIERRALSERAYGKGMSLSVQY